jgi:hypothetical protein
LTFPHPGLFWIYGNKDDDDDDDDESLWLVISLIAQMQCFQRVCRTAERMPT